MNSNKKLFALPVFLVLGYVSVLVVNALSVVVPLNGRTPGQISDALPSLFVPAGFTFTIWGVIYILLGALVVYTTLHLFKGSEGATPLIEEIAGLFVATCLANIMWVFTWQYGQVFLSMLSMTILLLLLMYSYQQLSNAKLTTKEFFWVKVPISVYFGWITVATIANMSALLVSIDWKGFGISPDIWTAVMIVIATIISFIVAIKYFDIAYLAVIIWALVGISWKHLNTLNGAHPLVLIVTASCFTVLFVCIVYSIVHTFKQEE